MVEPGSQPSVTLRRAVPDDQPVIRRLVHAAGLDWTSLHWSHFVVAEVMGDAPPDERIVGIGQIRPYPGCPELGSLVVRKLYRKQGIGGRIIGELLAAHPPPIYLECRASLAPYYERFGFREIRWHEAPVPLKLKAGAASLLRALRVLPVRVAVMRWDGPAG